MHVRSLIRTVVVAGLLGSTLVGVATPSTEAAADGFTPLPAPQRIVDTRSDGVTADGQFAKIGKRPAGSTLELKVGGRAGVPADAAAAVLNVTAVEWAGPGFLTVYPCDQPRPNSSNVNYLSGVVVANAVFAGLDGAGKTCIYTLNAVHIIVDVTGSLPPGAFVGLPAPQRIADTRPDGDTVDDQSQATGKVVAGGTLTVKIAGRAGVGSGATAAVLNVTVTEPEDLGFLTVYPCDQARPNSSNLNHLTGQVVANSVTTKLDGSGSTCIFSRAKAHIIVDVAGTLPSTVFVPLAAPQRLVDSRPDGETIDDKVEKNGFRRRGTTLQFPIGGRAGIPAGASAVILNVTAVSAKSPGFLTLHPRNSSRPNASNLNFFPGDVVANTVVAGLGGQGMVCLFASTDVEVIVDVAGYFIGPAPVDTGTRCPLEFGEGTYPVGEYQMPPGRYISSGPGNSVCEFFRWNTATFQGGQLGANIMFGNGQLMGDVRPTDPYVHFRFSGCAPLVPYVPVNVKATSFDRGFYVVNEHIAPGTYRAIRPFGSVCTGVRYSSLDGAESSMLGRFDDASATEVVMTILPSDEAFLAGCDDWVKIG